MIRYVAGSHSQSRKGWLRGAGGAATPVLINDSRLTRATQSRENDSHSATAGVGARTRELVE